VKLRVDDITGETKQLAFAEPEAAINRTLEAGSVHEFRLSGPVSVELSYYRAGTELFFSGEIEASAVASCARCAEEFVTPNTRKFRYVMVPRVLRDNDNGRVDELEFTIYDGDEIDLSPLLQEQVLLALPTRPLCKEDCRGLCPQCGINLNEHQCDCGTGQFQPRLSVLRNLKLSRN
jgi:uncharacterized protein